jgi:hypothetical protein
VAAPVHLDARPLYVDDAVAVLGAAYGTRHRFRYNEPLLPPDLAARWDKGLIGTPVAVHLSIQHPAGYHAPVYVPLRAGTVTDARRDGATLTVEFAVGGYLAVASPDTVHGADGEGGRLQRAAAVAARTQGLLVATGGQGPVSRHHAVIGKAPLLPPDGQDVGLSFQQLTAYVSEALHYEPRLLCRLAEVWDEDKDEEVRADEKTGVFNLRAGRRYTVAVAHHQREQPRDGTALAVTAPPPLVVLSESLHPVVSRYDVIPVRLFASHRDDFVVGELNIALTGPTAGPSLRMVVSVAPGAAVTAAVPLLGMTAAAFALFPPILSGGEHVPLRFALAAVAAVLAGAALRARRSRGLPG